MRPIDRNERGVAGVLLRVALVLGALAVLGALFHYGRQRGFRLTRPGGAPAAADDWCAGHGVPESECVACNPGLAEHAHGGGHDADDAHGDGHDHDDGHDHGPAPAMRAEVPPGVPGSPAECTTHLARVQVASEGVLERAGIRLETVEKRPLSDALRATGELAFDAKRVARVAPRAPGVVVRVFVESGARVAEGDLLALVEAAEVGRAKADLLTALAEVSIATEEHERLTRSRAEGLRTETDVLAAAARLREARVHRVAALAALSNLGLPADPQALDGMDVQAQAETLRGLGLPEDVAAAATSTNLLPVRAPQDGTIVERLAVVGETVGQDRPLFVTADPTAKWALLDVRQEDAARLAVGQAVTFRVDGSTEPAAHGVVEWIHPAVDDATRTVKVRAVLPDPEERLRAHAFGVARVVTREEAEAIAVAPDAVHWDGCCSVVFVRDGATTFRPRKVALGARTDAWVEVRSGLEAGEVVATAGSHALKATLLKSRLGAGCVDH